MKINEIFYSIQGEGKWVGQPNIFIRTTGCNLRCTYCDTKYAYSEGKEKMIDEILKIIQEYPCNKVCVTGGEPLIQKDTVNLIKRLLEQKYSLIVETNGSINIEKISKIKETMISLDIKCPSSKMHKKMDFTNLEHLTKKDQLKFVIQNKKDYNYAKEIMQKYKPKTTIYFQPVWKTNVKNLAKWILKDGLPVALGLQIHKIIWEEKEKQR